MNNNFLQRYKFDLFNIVLIVMGIAFLVQAWEVWTTAMRLEPIGPGGLPLVFSGLTVVGVASLIVIEVTRASKVPSYRINIRDVRTIRTLFAIFLTLLFMFTVGEVGFLIASFVYLSTLTVVFGATKRVHIVLAIVFSVIATLAIYFAYTELFKFPLPGVI